MSDQQVAERSAKIGGHAPVTRRVFSNYAFQLINQFLRLSAQLILVPLFLAAWGPEVYKDWIVLFSVASFLGACNFGSGTYFANRFIELIARHDREGFRRELHAALFCSLTLGIVILALAYAIIAACEAAGVLHASAMTARTVWACLILMTFPVGYSFSQEILRSIYLAEGELARGECVFSIYLSLLTGFVALVLALKMPPIVTAVCYFVLPLFLAIGIIVDVKWRYSGIVLRLRVPTAIELRRIVPNSLMFFAAPLSTAAIQNGPIILFGILGVPAVPILSYSLIRVISGLARQSAFQFANGSGIEMARQQRRGDAHACAHLYFVTGRIVTGMIGLLSGFVVLAAAPFLGFWTHGTVPSDQPLLLTFLVGLFVAAPGQAALMFLNFMNLPKAIAAAWSGQAILGIALSAIFVPIFGVGAAAISFAAIEALTVGICLPIIVQRRFGLSAVRQAVSSVSVGLAAFLWSFAVAKLAFGMELGGIKGLAAAAAIWAAFAVPPFGLLVLPQTSRRMVISRITRYARGLVC